MIQPRPLMTPIEYIAPLGVAAIYVGLNSLIREPARQRFNAIMLAGAGAAYLGGGLGPWELGFCAVMTAIAYGGLTRYRLIGLGWVLHAGWDLAHHLYGNPIIPFLPLSSAGCGICDLALAAWFFAGAPSPFDPRPIRDADPA